MQTSYKFVLLFAGAVSLLEAGSFRVAPVRIDLNARQPYTTLQVTNVGTERVTIQVDAYEWRIKDGQDQYVETDDILMNPPIFTCDPGATQLLRLGIRQRDSEGVDRTHPEPPLPRRRGSRQIAATAVEKSYRLVLEEVPSAVTLAGTGIQTRLRMSIPIFFLSAPGAAPELVWSASRQSDGKLVLAVENHGTQHAQVRQLSAVFGDHHHPDFMLAAPSYVLPGTRREWIIANIPVPVSARFQVQGQTDGGQLLETVRVTP